MTRYPLTLRLIHWFTALMSVPMLAGGYFALYPMSSSDPFKLDAFMYHMAAITGHFWHGATALALTLIIALHIAGAFKDRATLTRMT